MNLHSKRGSALLVTVGIIMILAVLAGSMINYGVQERKLNERHRLLLRARNMSENVSVYAAEQLTVKLSRLRTTQQMAFTTGSNQIYLPPDSVMSTGFTGPSDVEVYAGITSSSALAEVTDVADNYFSLYVSRATAPVISKAYATHASIGTLTAYTQHDIQLSLVPLFQFAIFYNIDLEFSPGVDMTITGPVHTNGNLIARNQTGFSNTVAFQDRTTAALGFYANTTHKGKIYMDTGSSDDGPGGGGALNFQSPSPSSTVTNINSGTIWRDHKWGTGSETTSTQNSFSSWSTSTYAGNLRTSVHAVKPLYPPGVDATTPAAQNPGRRIIKPAASDDSAKLKEEKVARKAGLYIVVNPDDDTRNGILPDTTTVSMPGRSYRCWLNTVDTSGNHTLTEVVLPGQPSYGASNGTRNNLPNRYTDLTAILSNQVLRIPDSGRATDKAVGHELGTPSTAHALLAQPAGYPTSMPTAAPFVLTQTTTTVLPHGFFFDLRRATNSNGYPFSRTSATFAPRPIAKIDFDWLRFKFMVERTVNGATVSSASYWPNFPRDYSTAAGAWNRGNALSVADQWASFIYNPAAVTRTFNLGVNHPAASGSHTNFPIIGTNYGGVPATYTSDPFKLYYASGAAVPASALVSTSTASPWFDGITVYIHSVDAEVLTETATGVRNRMDSGVRFWNGRGPLVSLNGVTYPARTGSNVATNDCAYIVGHYNADGTIVSNSAATGTGTGYSGRFPDSTTEKLTVVNADAITILSQPTFEAAGGTYRQNGGWNDALSGHRRDNAYAWSASWATTNPSDTNRQDGIAQSLPIGLMPNVNDGGAINRTEKFGPTVTEVSSCLLTGIVETTSQQTSGGVHNFPRMLEGWGGTGLYIRGSMVAMFRSEVGTEPWSIRIYHAPGRYWGFHESLKAVDHDVPLEPIVATAERQRYYEITAAEYATKKAQILALPVP